MVEQPPQRRHMKNSHRHGFWYAFNLTAFILIVLFAIAAPLLHAFELIKESVDIHATQATKAALLHVPTSFTVDIQNGSSTLLNAAEFELHYDPNALLVTSIVPHSTLCEDRFIITNAIDNASGTALFQCGTVTPFAGKAGTIATVYVTPLVSGTSSVTFGTSTHVLAHDGMGTDATRKVSNLVFSTI